jgi:hypothetical protein
VAELLATAGFEDIGIMMDLIMGAASLVPQGISDADVHHHDRAVRGLAPAERYQLRDLVDAGYSPYVRDDGTLKAPARALKWRRQPRREASRAHNARRAFGFWDRDRRRRR